MNAALGLAQPCLTAPLSPAKDLIPASYPDGIPGLQQPNTAVSEPFLPDFFGHSIGELVDRLAALYDSQDSACSQQRYWNAGLNSAKSRSFADTGKDDVEQLSVRDARAGLSAAAYPTSFAGSMHPLKPYRANTAINVLDPSGLVPELANSFLPKNTDTREGMVAYSGPTTALCKSQQVHKMLQTYDQKYMRRC